MPHISETAIFWIGLATQIAGVSSVFAGRFSERSWRASVFRRTYFVSFIAVGLATVLAIQLHAANWLIGAATLGLMAVGATLDLGDSRSTAPDF
jgi:hypothetical protein